MVSLIVGLVVFALAFPAGWLVCRAWLHSRQAGTVDSHTAMDEASGGDMVSREQHHALLKAQRNRYRRRVRLIHDVVRRHETTRDQIRAKLTELQKNLDTKAAAAAGTQADLHHLTSENEKLRSQLMERETTLAAERSRLKNLESQLALMAAPASAADSETALLRMERDELSARVRRLEPPARQREQAAADDEKSVDKFRAALGEARETVAARDHRIRELELKLKDRDQRIEELQGTVDSWKHRVTPLARQLQLQRELIRRSGRRAASAVPETPEPSAPVDDLQRIRGIGPALERRLRAEGIERYAQIASLTPEDLAALAERLAIAASLPERDQWVAQAVNLQNERYAQSA